MAFKVADAYVEVSLKGPSDAEMALTRARINRGLSGSGNEAKKSGSRSASSFLEGFNSGLSKLSNNRALSSLMKLSAVGTILVPTLGAAATGFVSLVDAIAPAVPAAGALGGAMLSLKQATVIAGVGLDGFSKAVGSGAQKDLDALTPAAAHAAVELRALNKPLKEGIQQQLFKNTGDAIHKLGGIYLPVLNQAGQDTASVLNGIALKGAKMAQTPIFKKDVQDILQGNAQSMKQFGDASLSGINIVKDLGVAVQPLTLRFSKFVNTQSDMLAGFIDAKKQSGELTAFFNKAGDDAAEWGGALKDVTVGLYNVFKIGKSNDAKTLLDTISQGSQKFRDWTESVKGQNSIKSFFDQGRDAGNKLLGLVQKVGPIWSNFTDSKNFDSLVTVGGDLLTIAGDLTGGLTGFLAVMKPIADAVAWIIENVPGAAGAISGLLVTLGGLKALNMLGFGGLIGKLGGLKGAVKDAAGAATAATGSGGFGGLVSFLGGPALLAMGGAALGALALRDALNQTSSAAVGVNTNLAPLGLFGLPKAGQAAKDTSLALDKFNSTIMTGKVLTASQQYEIGKMAIASGDATTAAQGLTLGVEQQIRSLGVQGKAITGVVAKGDAYVSAVKEFGAGSIQAKIALDQFTVGAGKAQAQSNTLSGAVKKTTADIKGVPGQKKTKMVGDLKDLQAKVAASKQNIASVPPSKRSKLLADIAQAEANIKALKAKIAGVNDKTVTINENTYVRRIQVGAGTSGYKGKPGGGGIGGGAKFAAAGGILSFYANGGMAPMAAGVAQVVPPRTMRVIGDRSVDDEFYIPDNNSPRSLAIGAEWMRRRGLVAAPTAPAVQPVVIQNVNVHVAAKDLDDVAKVVKAFKQLPVAVRAQGGR